MTVLSIDYETRSGTDIKRGLPRYIGDGEFTPLCLAYRFWDSKQAPELWLPGDPLPYAVEDHIRGGGTVAAFNALFEYLVWNEFCVPEYGWPALKLEQMQDTMAEAAAMNLPQSLGKLAEVLLPPEFQKDRRGGQLIKLLCVPQKSRANAKTPKARWNNDPALMQELYAYCRQDVVAEEAAAKKLRRLTPYEQKIWVMTQVINQRGVPIATDEIESIVSVVEAEKSRLNDGLKQLTKYEVGAASEAAALTRWCNKQMRNPLTVGIEDMHIPEDETPLMDNMRADTVEQELKRTDLPPQVRRALEIRAAVAQSSTAKFAKMLTLVAEDGTLKNMHEYHGAGTGRDASRGGMNLQNLTRPIFSESEIVVAHDVLGWGDIDLARLLWGDQVMDGAVSCLRGVIKAKPGYKFLDADFSSVENRVAAWLAGQQNKLDLFTAGLDEYKTFASQALYHVPYEQVTKDQRQRTKPVILGGIFGLGHKGLVDYAQRYSVNMSLEEAKVAIQALRSDYNKLAALWYRCGDAALEAVHQPGVWFDAGAKLKLMCHRNFLWMKLPSGRLICWAQPRIENRQVPWTKTVQVQTADGDRIDVEEPVYRDCVTVCEVDSYTRKWKRHPLIGSSIFQSGVQATARDLLMNGMCNLEDAGYTVILRVHDELLCHVPENFGSPEEMGQLMCKAPDWAAGLPLNFEAWTGARFHK